jgi:PhnB protein
MAAKASKTKATETVIQGPTPYIAVRDANTAIAFYVKAFGATELFRLIDPSSGKIGHAELRFGDAIMMISDEFPGFGAVAPETLGGSPTKFHLYVADVDSFFAQAVAAGGTELRKVDDQFHGDRQGMLMDPFGHSWFIASRKEAVTPAEMQERWNASAN